MKLSYSQVHLCRRVLCGSSSLFHVSILTMCRFGTGSGMKKPESLNTSEELKRKARAERFFPSY